MNKIDKIQSVQLMRAYLNDMLLRVQQEEKYSQPTEIKAEVPQRKYFLAHILPFFTRVRRTTQNVTTASFEDGTTL